MGLVRKFNNALKKMDLYIHPSQPLLKKIMILFDRKMMEIFYGYNIEEYYGYEFYRLKLSARKEYFGNNNGLKELAEKINCNDEINKFENKILFNEVFADYIYRDWRAMSRCSFDEFCSFCKIHSSFMKKPVDEFGGFGIEKYSISNETDLGDLYNKLKNENCLIEEILIQDNAIASFNPSSINTLRLYSVHGKSKTIISFAMLRMGVGNTVVDNWFSGGLAAKIDVDTGIVVTPGKDMYLKSYILHPYTNKQIVGFKIPRWSEIIKTVEEAALVVPAVRYVGWDIITTDKGNICLIEGNHDGGIEAQEVLDLHGKKWEYKNLLHDLDIT